MRPLRIQNPPARIPALQDEIRRSEQSRYDHRLHAVLLVAQGLTPPQAATWLGDAVRTVELWVHRFEANGLEGLRERARPGRPSRLNADQAGQVQAALRASPGNAGLNADRWNSESLSAYLHSLGVDLKPRQCRNLLRQWGHRQA